MVAIIDYGVGNLFSLKSSFASLGEEAIVTTENESGSTSTREEEEQDHSPFNFKNLLWHGGSVWDAWFSCASNQVNHHTQ